MRGAPRAPRRAPAAAAVAALLLAVAAAAAAVAAACIQQQLQQQQHQDCRCATRPCPSFLIQIRGALHSQGAPRPAPGGPCGPLGGPPARSDASLVFGAPTGRGPPSESRNEGPGGPRGPRGAPLPPQKPLQNWENLEVFFLSDGVGGPPASGQREGGPDRRIEDGLIDEEEDVAVEEAPLGPSAARLPKGEFRSDACC